MKKITYLFALACAAFAVSCRPTSIVWTEGETDPETKQAVNTITIVNPPKGNDWVIWFAANHIEPDMQEGSQAVIKRYNGCMYHILPNAEHDASAMKVIYGASPIPRQCWAPEGFSLQKGNMKKQLKAVYEYLPTEPVANFEYTKRELKPWDMIPALKSYAEKEGETTVNSYPEAKVVWGKPDGWYHIVLDGECLIEASDEDGAYYATVTLDNLKRNVGSDVLPNCEIEDWPDLGYRGFMLDVSRNFTSKQGILKLLDVLAHYKASALHLHLGDDEGWRLEIPGLPELTGIGAHHGLPDLNEDGTYSELDCLIPSYSGKIDPKSADNTGNGYYSHDDFIEILRYAWERRIRIIPEFDSPGHARAAVKAMEKYAERTGDGSYLLSEAEDESKYVSTQYYTDNAINVALPTTYNFFGKVFDELVKYYAEAGAPLEQVHVGGDEVPEGAWMGSPACQKLMEDNGWESSLDLKTYFVENLAAIAVERGLKLAGWQEVVTGITPEAFGRIKPALGKLNFWNTRIRGGKDQLPYAYANQGVDVILSNMTNAYIDFAYNYDKLERGHSWGGFVDERRSFCILPYDIYRSVRWDDYGKICDIASLPEGKTALEAPEHIVGIQGQLWSETIRCFDNVTYYIFPKAVGLWERGWNASPAWEGTTVADDPAFVEDFDRFYSIIVDREMPYYESVGICYRKRN